MRRIRVKVGFRGMMVQGGIPVLAGSCGAPPRALHLAFYFIIAALPSLAFSQAVRVDIPLQTAGPAVPVSGGALPQTLWVANASVAVCVHVVPASQSYSNCVSTPITTYTDVSAGTPCASTTPLVQLPGSTCTASTGATSNLGIWYNGGIFDYYVVSSYGIFGPYTYNTVAGGSAGPFLPTTGGTLTGGLNGTSAAFNGTVSATNIAVSQILSATRFATTINAPQTMTSVSDSIGAGSLTTAATNCFLVDFPYNCYMNRIATAWGVAISNLFNYGVSNSQIPDIINSQIMPHIRPNVAAVQPANLFEDSTNDADIRGTAYLPTFALQDVAAMLWYTMEQANEVDGSTMITTGTCANDTTYSPNVVGTDCTASGSTATAGLVNVPAGSSVTLIYRAIDSDTGTASCTLNGANAQTFTTALSPAVGPTSLGSPTSIASLTWTSVAGGNETLVCTQTANGSMALVTFGYIQPGQSAQTAPYVVRLNTPNQAGAVFSASSAGTTLTVGSSPTPAGTIAVGMKLYGIGIPLGTTITALGTGTGGAGTYTISNGATVSSETMSTNPGTTRQTAINAYRAQIATDIATVQSYGGIVIPVDLTNQPQMNALAGNTDAPGYQGDFCNGANSVNGQSCGTNLLHPDGRRGHAQIAQAVMQAFNVIPLNGTMATNAQWKTVFPTANYAAGPNDNTAFCNNNYTITLPPGQMGEEFRLVNNSTSNPCLFTPAGSDQVVGLGTYPITLPANATGPRAYIRLQCYWTGTFCNWYDLGDNWNAISVNPWGRATINGASGTPVLSISATLQLWSPTVNVTAPTWMAGTPNPGQFTTFIIRQPAGGGITVASPPNTNKWRAPNTGPNEATVEMLEYDDSATTWNVVACYNQTDGTPCSGGTVTYTSNHNAVAADNGTTNIMNCGSACAFSLPATTPANPWNVKVQSIGATLATINLNGATFNGGASAPVLNKFAIQDIAADSATNTDYVGSAPLIAGTNVTITPAANGLTVASSGGGGGGLSGMTAGQVPIAATASTVTSSQALAGAGASIVTGPASSTSGDVVTYTGTAGQTQDSGTLLTALAPLASPALTGTPTAPTAAAGTSTTQIATTAFVGGRPIVGGFCSGVATSSATLVMPLTGGITANCTGTASAGVGIAMAASGTLANLTVRCATTGVNSSSGVFTVYKQASGASSYSATTITLTYGTTAINTTLQDTTHTVSYGAGDLVQIRFTTQGSETLGTCSASFQY